MLEKEIFKFLSESVPRWLSLLRPDRIREDYPAGKFKRLRGVVRRRGQRLSRFPNDIVRRDIALSELERLGSGGAILDVGCGPGKFTIELLRRGYAAVGTDVSPAFIGEAKRNLVESGLGAPPDQTFLVEDVLRPAVKPGRTFDSAVALGMFEYLDKPKKFFASLARRVKPGGWLVVECRNKLFNVFSANQYTLLSSKKNELAALIAELAEADRYSPLPARYIPMVHLSVARAMARLLPATAVPTKRPQKPFFLTSLTRQRQYTPREIEELGQAAGFRLSHIIYQHLHPYPPRYEDLFWGEYDKMSVVMAPLGYTSIGAWAGSSFIAVLKKK